MSCLNALNVMVVHEDGPSLTSLQALFSQSNDISVTCEHLNSLDALSQWAQSHDISSVNCALVSLTLDGLSAVQIVEQFKQIAPGLPIVVIFPPGAYDMLGNVLLLGVHGFLGRERMDHNTLLYTLAHATRQFEAMHELERGFAKTEIANMAKSNFLTVMSAELFDPVSTVFGLTNLLKMTELTTRQKEYVTRIDAACEILNQYVERMLQYASLQTDVLASQVRSFVLPLMLEPLLEQKSDAGVTIQYEEYGSVPACMQGPEWAIRMIIVELVANAKKHSDSQIRLSASCEAHDAGGHALKISVYNDGQSLQDTELEALAAGFLEKMVKADAQAMGVYLSKKLAGLVGGELTASNLAGGGCCFTLSVPVVPLELESELRKIA